jgi:hypothetical protein
MAASFPILGKNVAGIEGYPYTAHTGVFVRTTGGILQTLEDGGEPSITKIRNEPNFATAIL